MEQAVRWMQNVVAAAATPLGVEYILNDPSTPALIEVIAPPKVPTGCPDFTVVGYQEGNWGCPGSLQYQAAQLRTTLLHAITAANKYFRVPINSWAGTQNLVAIPRAGKQFNAYYDRVSLRFFYNLDPVTKKMVYTCESQDVTAHEAGHAILDARRPDLWNMQAIEVMSMHEAFGDVQAIMTILQHESILNWVLQETNGDLSRPSIVTRVGEEMGQAIYHATDGNLGHRADALRNAVNDFVYVPPEKLPERGRDDVLVREPHSFSRVFVGVFWDILKGIYDIRLGSGDTPTVAIRRARDDAGKLAYLGFSDAPAVGRFMNAVATAMLRADTECMGAFYGPLLTAVFAKRGLVSGNIPLAMVSGKVELATAAMPARGLDLPVVASMHAPEGAGGGDVLVTLPMAAFDGPEPTAEAAMALAYLERNGLVGDEAAGKMFSVDGGQLVRNFMCFRGC